MTIYSDHSTTDLEAIAAKNYQYAQDCLKTAEEIRELEAETAEILVEQGDQIRRIGGHVDTVHETLEESEKKLNVITSIFGNVQNWFKKKDKKASSVEPVARKAEPEQGHFITRRHRELQRQKNEVDYQELDRKTDEAVDLISLALQDMKKMAIAMGQELDRHNEDLSTIETDVDVAIPRLQRATRAAKKAAN